MPRMRTISEAAEELKADDPKTAVNPHFIRKLILNNEIPYIKAGNKYLLNLDILIDYLANPQAKVVKNSGSIRPIKV